MQDKLDYETQNSYQLTARATDSYSGKWAEVVVSVQVIDVNDNPPIFLQHFYNITVSEATAIATPILSVTTTDQDTGTNAGVSYGLLGLNGTAPKHFYMEAKSGMLILKQRLDRERTPVHHFLVQAVDKGTPQLSSTAHVLITGEGLFLVGLWVKVKCLGSFMKVTVIPRLSLFVKVKCM